MKKPSCLRSLDLMASSRPAHAPDEATRVRRHLTRSLHHFATDRGTRFALVAGLLGLITVAAIAAVTVARDPPPVPIRPYSLLRVDPTTGEFLADVVVDELGSPPAEVPSTQEIWLSAQTSQVISIIDATSNGRSTLGGSRLSQAVAQGFGLTYLNGSVWVSGEGDQVDPDLAKDPSHRSPDPAARRDQPARSRRGIRVGLRSRRAARVRHRSGYP